MGGIHFFFTIHIIAPEGVQNASIASFTSSAYFISPCERDEQLYFWLAILRHKNFGLLFCEIGNAQKTQSEFRGKLCVRARLGFLFS